MDNVCDWCILFVYCNRDDVTMHHLNMVKRHNPDVPVVVIASGAHYPIPGAIDVERCPSRWSIGSAPDQKWYHTDAIVYRWFENRTLTAKRYIWVEWDCLCTGPLDEFYRPVWNRDLAASRVVYPDKDPDWCWFREMDRLGDELRPYACGVIPCAGTLLSHDLLEAVAECRYDPHVICELRLGTVARRMGFQPFEIPNGQRFILPMDAEHGIFPKKPCECLLPGLYHPVKEM